MSNLEIWNKVKTTDQAYTKKGQGGQGGSTAINAHYMIREATKTFGPIGIGWGYEVLEENFIEAEHIYMTIGQNRVLDGINKNHTIKLKLWFKYDGEKGEVIDYGHTKYSYKTKGGSGYWFYDEEVSKKSLTDAIKRCLSKIGICADIYLGEFDDQNYQAEAAQEIYVEKETAKLDKKAAKLEEEAEQHQHFIDSIEAAKTENELKRLWIVISDKCLLMSQGTKRQEKLLAHYNKKMTGLNND